MSTRKRNNYCEIYRGFIDFALSRCRGWLSLSIRFSFLGQSKEGRKERTKKYEESMWEGGDYQAEKISDISMGANRNFLRVKARTF